MQAPRALFRTWLQSMRGDATPPTWGDTVAAGSEGAGIEALQAGLELATQGILLVDADWRIVTFNSQAKLLMNAPGNRLAGGDFWQALPEAVADKHRSISGQALQGGAPHVFMVHHLLEDQWIEYTLKPHAGGAVVNLRDISDTRQALLLLQGSELCNQSLFDGNTQPMWLLDTETHRVLAVNKAAGDFYDLPIDLTVMPQVEEFFHEGEAAPWLASLRARDAQQRLEVCTQRKADGELVLVELACSAVQWFERPAVLVSVVDVGARHFADVQLQRVNDALEERMAQCNADLQHSRAEIHTFTQAMSDDLKAPLHVVSGFAATLAERYSAVLDEQGRRYLSRIRASTRQLAKLFDDLRTLAHLPAVAISPAVVDLAPVCQRLIETWRKREPERQLVLEIPASLPVFGDRDLLVTAMDCLLDNAWKFTARKGQGWIKVGLVPGDSPGHSVLAVADNGVGFDGAYTDKLFTAFQRLHSSADFAGGGLGLAIVKRVAERHGGSAWASTTEHGGATFFLSLPQAPQDPAP